jgi:hypothetical protein
MSESDCESEEKNIACECDDMSDVLNWIRLAIDEYQKTKEEKIYFIYIPAVLVGDLITFKKSIPELVDVFEEIVIEPEYDRTGLEHSKYSENYIGVDNFTMLLFFKYEDENSEILEIQVHVFFEEYSDDMSEESTQPENSDEDVDEDD